MDVNDQSVCGAIRILDLEERRTALGRHGGRGGPVIPGEENHLLLRDASDCRDNGLNSITPLVDIGNVMGL